MLKETTSVMYSEQQTYHLDQNHQCAEKNVSAGSDMIRFYWLRHQIFSTTVSSAAQGQLKCPEVCNFHFNVVQYVNTLNCRRYLHRQMAEKNQTDCSLRTSARTSARDSGLTCRK